MQRAFTPKATDPKSSITDFEQEEEDSTDDEIDEVPVGRTRPKTDKLESRTMTKNESPSRDEITEVKNQPVCEITELKDNTDSSKDDDTLNEHIDTSKVVAQVGPGESAAVATMNAFDGDIDMDELYDEEYDIDLTKSQTDQALAKSGWLLDSQPAKLSGRKTLVLDLDETLVHSSFKYVRHCDFVIPVEIEGQVHNVYVIKRPGVDEFLKRCGEMFEVVVFTASVSRYGDPLLDILDTNHSVHQRLFRESCYNYQGNYIKNLSQLGRPLEDVIIIDNSPASYIFHPQHSVPISSWFSDTHDCELTDLLPLLTDLAGQSVDDVRLVLDVNV